MTSKIKKVLAILLVATMALSTNVYAYAESGITLSIDDKTDFYAGVTYEVTATAKSVPESDLIKSTLSAFTWSCDDFNVISSNNYYYSLDGENYTVTESAKFTLPQSQTDKAYTLKVSYGDLYSTTKTINPLQPIESIDVSSNNTDNSVYDSANNVLYINNDKSASFDVTVSPETNDDAIVVTTTATKDVTASVAENSFRLTVGDKCTSDFDMYVTPKSGYKFQKVISVVNSIETESFYLKNNGTAIQGTESFSSTDGESSGTIRIMQDESFTVNPYTKTGNDEYVYFLTNATTGEVINEFYTVDKNFNCTVNIHNPGTYLLECITVSKGSTTKADLEKGESILERDQTSHLYINVGESNPITDLGFYKLKDGELTDQNLDSITLYTNTEQGTYNLSSNLSVLPNGYTNSVTYATDNEKIATVNASTGVVTAVSTGKTRIFAISDKNQSIFASCEVEVKVGIKSIDSISAELDTLPAGHSEALTAVVTPTANDENISWASAQPEILQVDENGIAIANENYDFGDSQSISIPITATSQFGKTYTKYITVVPAIRATDVSLTATDTNSDILESNSQGEYISYVGKTFTLSATAVDENGTQSNDKLEWRISVGDDTSLTFDEAGNSVLKYVYSKNTDDSYQITPVTSGKYVFTCYATRNGEGITDESVKAQLTIDVVAKATKVTIVKPSTGATYSSASIPEGEYVEIGVVETPISASVSDPVTYKSSDETVATVEFITDENIAVVRGIKAGSASIKATTKSGSASATFKVTVTNNINQAEVTGVKKSYTYTGSAIKPSDVTISYNGITMSPAYYTVSYSNNTKVGTAKIIFTGKGEFAGSTKEVEYSIVAKSIKGADITVTPTKESYTLTTSSRTAKATFTVKDTTRKVTLTSGKDYEIVYKNNTVAGTATATIKGIGNYKGSISQTFKVIDQASMFTVSSISDKAYDGTQKQPKPSVYYNGKKLTLGTDYTLSYGTNKSVGVGKITIKGTGERFTGSTTVSFKIIPAKVKSFKTTSQTKDTVVLSWAKSTDVTGYEIYNAKTNKLIASVDRISTVTFTNSSLKAGTNYQYKIRAYKKVGSTVYYGAFSSVVSTYTKPNGVKINSVTAGSGKLTVKWNKGSSITGYQVQVSTTSDFKSTKTVTVSNASTLSKTITGLKKNTKYYVRVRTYKTVTVNDKTVKLYSAWSSTKTKATSK